MNIKDYITIDKRIMGGQTVFKGTRVPIESLFDYIEAGISINEFLVEFPTVSKDQVTHVLEWSSKIFNSEVLEDIYEVVA